MGIPVNLHQVQVIVYDKKITLDVPWYNLVQYVQKNPFCEMKVIFKDGKPFEAIRVKESIRF